MIGWLSDEMSPTTGRTTIAFAAILACFSIVLCGCREPKTASSALEMADPSIAGQLLKGFYPVEEKSFRWVGRSFSVALKPPPHARADGLRLIVNLYLPEAEIRDIGPLTLSATLDGKTLGVQVFTEPGSFDFIRDLSAGDVDTNILPLQFCFDKSFQAGGDDRRKLAGIIRGISLVAKQDR